MLPGQEKPYYIQYRLLDLDERTIVAQFGALVSTSTTHDRYMNVDLRIGDYKLDSSNFISEGGFRDSLAQPARSASIAILTRCARTFG